MSWKENSPRYLHIELSTHCNAACPLCPRFYEGTNLVRPDLELSQISLNDFKKYFPEVSIQRLYKILYCGTMGDPMMAKDALKIFEYVNKINANCEQVVHSNGGMRDEKFWKKMGILFQRPKMRMVFSIDGLEDTNHIYRRNVKWNKLMTNVQAFINSGGDATWEFLIFKHNEHQVEQARELSINLGFTKFLAKRALGFDNPVKNVIEPRMVFNKNGKLDYKIYPPSNTEFQNAGSTAEFKDNFYELSMNEYNEAKELKFFPKIKNKIDTFSDKQAKELGEYEKELNANEVKCKSHFDHFTEVYINAKGILFPCCFVGTRFDSNVDNFLDHQLKSKIIPRQNELDLNNRSMEEIIASGVLEEIFQDSWKKKTIRKGKMAYCSETCGQNSPLDRLYL